MQAQRPGQYAFYCLARLHTINPTSQWNCPGNSPWNYGVWFLVYKALPITFQRIQAAPVHLILSGGPRSTKGSSTFTLGCNGTQLWPSRLPRGVGGKAGGCWAGGCPVFSPGGIGAIVQQYPGMPFVEGQNDCLC